jgi:hypothetical protein
MISPKFLSLALLITPFLGVTNTLSAKAEPPTPGKAPTNAGLLSESGNASNETAEAASGNENVAQLQRRGPSPRSVRRNPYYPNYIGVGLNVGLDGDTALGNTEFAINSRIQLTPDLSFRPGAVIGNNSAILVPLTYDFTTRDVEVRDRGFSFNPYIGGGVFFTTDDESEDDLGGLLTTGVDVPLSRQFTANAGLNVGFIDDETEWGISVGIGYNLPQN